MAEPAQKTASRKGKEGESAAVRALEKDGMRILYRNFRYKTGEIDIIALDGEVLVFVEVKTRSSGGVEELDYSVGVKKKRRIIETAKYFLSIYRQYNDSPIRFDVVFLRSSDGLCVRFESAFTET